MIPAAVVFQFFRFPPAGKMSEKQAAGVRRVGLRWSLSTRKMGDDGLAAKGDFNIIKNRIKRISYWES